MEFTKKTAEVSNETNIKEHILSYVRYWYVFIISVIIALIAAFVYLRYTIPKYRTQATIAIKSDQPNGGLGALSPFSQLNNFSSFGDNMVGDELEIFKSKRIVAEAVSNLNLNIDYRTVGTIITSENYENKPFVIQYVSLIEGEKVPPLYIRLDSKELFTVSDKEKTFTKTSKFGDRIKLPFGEIIVIPIFDNSVSFDFYIGSTIITTYKYLDDVAFAYQRNFEVLNEKKFSNIVKILMETPVPKRAEDFINELIIQYNKDANKDRNQIAQKTSNFIDDRLDIITQELDSVERSKEKFKSNNRLTDIETEAQIILENASDFNKKQLDVGTQLELANTMVDYMEKATANDLLPANIGLEGEDIASAVNNYNQLILERNRLLKTSTSQNPVVLNINNQIDQIRSGILSSLKNTANGLKIAMRDLNYQQSSLNSKISQVPTKEKLFRGIERQQSIKEQLYLFLLQQREEASISLAITSPKAKIIDSAYSSKNPISPKKAVIYLSAILFGLVIPFLAIYLLDMFNTKVNNRKDIESALQHINMLGEIPKLEKGAVELIQANDRSILAESFRILRTNVQYKFGISENSKRIFVTSTIKGEGKTFVAFNFALSLAQTGKKVVLVGGDIRNPQLHRYLKPGENKRFGLTEFIVDKSISVEDIIMKSEFNENLDLVLSGEIPPNPAELLLQQRTTDFFTETDANYDYIIVDTAPSMLVTDTLLINNLAHVTLYVVRAGITDKKLLKFLEDTVNEERLSNVAVVLNNVSINNFGYGNKYGYAYSNEKKSSWNRFFRRS